MKSDSPAGTVALQAAVIALVGAITLGALQLKAHSLLLRGQLGARWLSYAQTLSTPSTLAPIAMVLLIGYLAQSIVSWATATHTIASRSAFGRSIFEQITRGDLRAPIAPPPDADVVALHDEIDRMRGALAEATARLRAADERRRALFAFVASQLADPLRALTHAVEAPQARLGAAELAAIHRAAARIEDLLTAVRQLARDEDLALGASRERGRHTPERAPRGWRSRVRLGTKLAAVAFGFMVVEGSAQATAIAVIVRGRASSALSDFGRSEHLAAHAAVALAFYAFDALCVAVWINETVRPRVRALTSAARLIADGELSAQLPSTVEAEFVALHAALGDMQASLRRAVESIRRTQDSRRQLFADLAHELATPLSTVYALADALEEAPDARRRILLRQEVARLARLVEDIDDLARLDAPALSLHAASVNLAELVRAVASSAEIASGGALTIGLQTPSAARAQVDRQRIEQVIANLLLNVRRHASRDGTGRCWLTVTLEAPWIRVTLDDDGPGVDERLLPNLGKQLWRPDRSRHTTTGGHGLGLAIVASIIEKHHGELAFERSPRGGLRVSMRLPSE